MLTATLLAALLQTAVNGQVPQIKDPPRPDFKKRVDYVQWLRDQVRYADADNAWQDYRQFMEDDRELQIPADADRQLKQMLESPRPWHYDFKPLAPLASWLKANEAQMAACTAGSGRKFFARGYNQILWI